MRRVLRRHDYPTGRKLPRGRCWEQAEALSGVVDGQRPGSAPPRRLMWRVLRRHGYPPDRQEAATRTVLEQAERPLSAS